MKRKIDTWEDMVETEFPLSEIKEDSREFEIMKKAAENGIASAQYSMGMWYQEVAKDFENAKKWYKRAENNNHPSAKQAFKNLKDEVRHEKQYNRIKK